MCVFFTVSKLVLQQFSSEELVSLLYGYISAIEHLVFEHNLREQTRTCWLSTLFFYRSISIFLALAFYCCGSQSSEVAPKLNSQTIKTSFHHVLIQPCGIRAYLHTLSHKTYWRQSPQPLCSYLWCQVLRGSTEGFHGGTVCDPLFTQPKVCYLYVAVLV